MHNGENEATQFCTHLSGYAREAYLRLLSS
nr:MAG TPA: hypothetical protein [Caudoviricetes sp.]